MGDLFSFLEDHHISFERRDHPPVYTVEDVKKLVPNLRGTKTKNLFLRDNAGKRHFLVIVEDEKRVDMKAMPSALGSSRVSFGSADRLKKYLGIEPGSVSLLAVFNDPDHAVEVVIDEALWQSDAFQFHPLINTATLVLSKADIERFLQAAGHEPKIVEVPGL
jgi:Ala-tRNA(Pro) deacylase